MFIPPSMIVLYRSPFVKKGLNVKNDSCNTPTLPEQVCGIHVPNAGNSCCNIEPIYPVHN